MRVVCDYGRPACGSRRRFPVPQSSCWARGTRWVPGAYFTVWCCLARLPLRQTQQTSQLPCVPLLSPPLLRASLPKRRTRSAWAVSSSLPSVPEEGQEQEKRGGEGDLPVGAGAEGLECVLLATAHETLSASPSNSWMMERLVAYSAPATFSHCANLNGFRRPSPSSSAAAIRGHGAAIPHGARGGAGCWDMWWLRGPPDLNGSRELSGSPVPPTPRHLSMLRCHLSAT